MSLRSRILTLIVVLGCAAASAVCGGGSPAGGQPDSGAPGEGQGRQINGAGATFPNPLYSKWFSEYNKIHPDVRINYQSLGSGAGSLACRFPCRIDPPEASEAVS